LPELASVGRSNGAAIEEVMWTPGEHSLDVFRADVSAACALKRLPSTADANDDRPVHLVLGFSRAALGQTGDGHFSPVGAYHAGTDRVLLLDTARFKYPPHWVELERLWAAQAAPDPETGLPRGYLRVRAARASAACCHTAWAKGGGRVGGGGG